MRADATPFVVGEVRGCLPLSLALCCVRSRTRGEVVMNNPISLVMAVLVIILLVILILRLA